MFKKTFSKLLLISAMLFAGLSVRAQEGAYTGYTPYSIFGIGDIQNHGSAYHKGMGGVGIATRNVRYINYMNPAAVTARDSLHFIADMSLSEDNRVFNQGENKSAYNAFNIGNIAISFPLFGTKAAMMLGVQPYSSTGYQYSYVLDDPQVVGNTGNAVYSSKGNGSINKVFASAGVNFWKRLSLGVECDFYFGNISKDNSFTFAKSAYSTIYSGYGLVLNGTSAKFGLQYEQPIGRNLVLGIGATYSSAADLKGFVEDYKYTSGSSQNDSLRSRKDTLGLGNNKVNIPSEIGVGISINYADTWRAEINYTRSDWSLSGMDIANGFAINGSSKFSTRIAESYRAGFEIVPNRNDIRYYYRKCAYRVGAYYDKTYYAVDGNQVKDIGITVGASLPVFRLYNSVTFAVSAGQRASLKGNMIRERYVNLSVGFSFNDRWFMKYHYE